MIMAFIIKAYNSKELAALYNVTYHVFCEWVKDHKEDIGEQSARTWTPGQVQKMVDLFGQPPIKVKI